MFEKMSVLPWNINKPKTFTNSPKTPTTTMYLGQWISSTSINLKFYKKIY